MKHYHFTVIGYSELIDGSKYGKSCDITLIGYHGEEEALFRAKKLVKRPQYILSRIWECNTCAFQERMANAQEKLSGNDEI